MSTTKRTLVDLVLTASFRRERHSGLLLTDPLPDELPIDGTVEAQEAWGNLVSLQRRFIDVRAPDPWGFSDAIRQLHDALGKRFRDHDAQRPYMLSDLRFGPWGLTDEGASDWSVHTEGFVGRAFASDDEAREAWEEWAQFEKASNWHDDWGEDEWAWHRFVRGLHAREAFAELWAYRIKAYLEDDRTGQANPMGFVERHATELEEYVAAQLEHSAAAA